MAASRRTFRMEGVMGSSLEETVPFGPPPRELWGASGPCFAATPAGRATRRAGGGRPSPRPRRGSAPRYPCQGVRLAQVVDGLLVEEVDAAGLHDDVADPVQLAGVAAAQERVVEVLAAVALGVELGGPVDLAGDLGVGLGVRGDEADGLAVAGVEVVAVGEVPGDPGVPAADGADVEPLVRRVGDRRPAASPPTVRIAMAPPRPPRRRPGAERGARAPRGAPPRTPRGGGTRASPR